MSARFLLRLDDACPTMHRERWAAMERLCDDLDIRPIVAVVPDNRDPDLIHDAPDPAFWSRVRGWGAKGWTIAMHGLHHELFPITRRRSLVPLNDRSEVAGRDLATQSALIRRSWALFAAQDVRPTCWIAPAHSFDRNTLAALRAETSIRTISDGLALHPFRADGFTWLPQQLWQPERRRVGLWTICAHPNSMPPEMIARWHHLLAGNAFKSGLTDPAAIDALRPPNVADHAYRAWFLLRSAAMARAMPVASRLKRALAG